MGPRVFTSLLIVLAISSRTLAQSREKAFGNVSDATQAIFEILKPDRVDAFTDARFKAVSGDVFKVLAWSGQRGVLLEVPIAAAKANPAHKTLIGDGLVIIGPGPDLVSAAVTALESPAIGPGPPTGYEFSQEDSYYVWATKDSKTGRVSYRPQFAEGTRRTNEDVKLAYAKRLADRSTVRLSVISLSDAMLDQYSREVHAIADRQHARELKKSLDELDARLAENQRTLAAELDRQARLSNAAALIDKISAALSFAATVSAAASQIAAEDRPSIEQAKTPQELKDAVKKAIEGRAANIQGITQVITTDQNAMGVQINTVRVMMENGGAPSSLTVRLSTFKP